MLLVSMFGSASIAFSQQSKRFDPKSYPAGSFHVSRHDYQFSYFTVRIIHAKRVYDLSAPPPSYCRAWLEVRKDNTVVRQAYFDDIDPVGSSFGIFLPKHQPLEDYFVALKDGDYDGRLLLVGKDGSLTDLPGGSFFLTPDKRYLIGEHASDYASLIVFDVTQRRTVIDGAKEKLPGVGDWYLDNAGYFFTEDDETGQPQDTSQKTVAIYRLDLKRLKVARDVKTKARLESIQKIDYYPWQNSADCTSVP